MAELEEELLRAKAKTSISISEAVPGPAAPPLSSVRGSEVQISPPASPVQQGQDQDGFVTVPRRLSAKRRTLEHQSLHVCNRFSPLSECTPAEPDTLLIGSSIVRDMKLPAVSVRCYPGARVGDIEGQLRLLKQGGHRYRRVVVHAGGIDARRRQSEVLKLQVGAVCELAKSMADTVIFSGPLPNRTSDEMYSRHLAFDCWLARWCCQNGVVHLSHHQAFWEKPWLMRRDGIHPTLEGASLLSWNLAQKLSQLN